MSRIGFQPITVPNGVNIDVDASNNVTVKGPKGTLQVAIARELTLKQDEGKLTVERPNNLRRARSQHGLARTIINNCIEGVTKGHSKSLEIVGVGYRVQAQGKGLVLSMGYSHPVNVDPIDGINFELAADEKTRVQRIIVSGIDKALVGQVAADIRKVRKPEPYKGKGIRYVGEVVKLKAGKRAAAKK
ncbi:MAG TPA: 50S ribosomal protein L6 [Fimbriimonadaceae bacterium]|nr:50S ribosomal protein L6 [Fimbriimonadaceae bacterium]